MELALNVFGGHWSALASTSPLCYYQLIEQQQDHTSFVRQSLAISPWALFYLTGAPNMEPLLEPCLQPVPVQEPLLVSHQTSAEQLDKLWQRQNGVPSVIQLIAAGDDHRQVAALAAAQNN